jgi:hypothetical protein
MSRVFFDVGRSLDGDELTLHIAPVILGDGTRVLDHLRPDDLAAEQIKGIDSPEAAHIRYRIVHSSGA